MYDSPFDHTKQNNITQRIVHYSPVGQVVLVAKQGYIELHSQKLIKKLTSLAPFLGSVTQVLKKICTKFGMGWPVILIYRNGHYHRQVSL